MDLEWIAEAVGARRVRIVEHVQAVWGGHGELVRIALDDRTAIVKLARPPERKQRSFDVELAFYQHVAPRCMVRVPALLAWRRGAGEWTFVLEDLDAAGYRERVDEAHGATLDAALRWLAQFHAQFLGEPCDDAGTYWRLDARRDELAAIEDRALRDAAPAIAERLAAARFQTRVHGDPKEANFCFAPRDCAAVDFQYTGRACAMTDVAYLLYGRSDEPADGIAREHLATYFRHLRAALVGVDAAAIEREWRALYPIARLDFCRLLAGWRPALWRDDDRGRRFVAKNLALA